MQKAWFLMVIIGVLLSACTTTETLPPPPHTGQIEAIIGAEPRYEPYSTQANQDYTIQDQRYKIVQDPQNFSQQGQAMWDAEEQRSHTTAIGEPFDPYAFAAAHPTLPIPSYVRVTNLSNSRRVVVRINDRGPFVAGKIIGLTKTAADRLNLTSKTPVRIDFIHVAPDSTLSGPGTIGTEVVKQNFALPERPNIVSSSPVLMPVPVAQDSPSTVLPAPTADHPPVVSRTRDPQPSANNSDEYDQYRLPEESPSTASAHSVPVTPVTPPASGRLMVQVGALSDASRASRWQEALSEQFSVPGTVNQKGEVYRVQLGPFSSRQQAQMLQQRLQSEAQQPSFVIVVP